MKELKQRHLFSSKEFYLRDSGIRVINRTWKENLEYRIRYEDLGFELMKKREKAMLLPALAFSLVCGLSFYFAASSFFQPTSSAAGYWLGAAVVSLVLAALAFKRNNRDLVFLSGGTQTLELFRDKPNAAQVDGFILSIHAHINAYYKSKYGVVEEHLPQEVQLERFGWLLECGIISPEEHAELWVQVQINSLLQ